MVKVSICFQVLKLSNITNEVSMVKIDDGDLIEVTEYDKDHICFEVESKSCQPGHLVKVDGVLHLTEGHYPFSALGKVTSVRPQTNNKIKIRIELRSYDKELWSRFTSTLVKRQSELDRLFNVLKDAE